MIGHDARRIGNNSRQRFGASAKKRIVFLFKTIASVYLRTRIYSGAAHPRNLFQADCPP